jgi:hypothetical protein
VLRCSLWLLLKKNAFATHSISYASGQSVRCDKEVFQGSRAAFPGAGARAVPAPAGATCCGETGPHDVTTTLTDAQRRSTLNVTLNDAQRRSTTLNTRTPRSVASSRIGRGACEEHRHSARTQPAHFPNALCSLALLLALRFLLLLASASRFLLLLAVELV